MSKRTMERRFAPEPFEVRENADGTVNVRGWAAVYNQVAYGEVIRPGAFTKTCAENPDVSLLSNHGGLPMARTHNYLGKPPTLTVEARDRGLWFDAPNLDVTENPNAREVVSGMKRGDLGACSFAFYPMLDRTVDGVRELLEVSIDGGDVSIVNNPWYDQTAVEMYSAALVDLAAGRTLTPECRAALLDRINEPAVEDRGRVLARALAGAEHRDLNGWTFDALWPLLDDAVENQMQTLHPERPYIWGYVCDVSDTWLVYWQSGDGCFQVDYTVTANGVVTLSDPQPVVWKITYLPAPVDPDTADPEANAMTDADIEAYKASLAAVVRSMSDPKVRSLS